MESPEGALSSTPDRDTKKAGHSALPPQPVGRNDSQGPVPNPKAQECDPLIHWGKPQHETSELRGNKQTHPSPPPLPVGHSRVEESPAPLKEMGSRAHASQPKHPGIGPLRSPSSSATQSSLHRSLTVPPEGGGPTGGWPRVSRSGLARLGPARSNPATRRSPASPDPRPGSRVGPRLRCTGRRHHPVHLIHHPIAFRRLDFKGPSAVFLLACQLSSSAIMSDYESLRLAPCPVTPSPTSQLQEAGICPGSDLDVIQLAQLAELLPRPGSPSPPPPPSPLPVSSRKRLRKSAHPPVKRRRGRSTSLSVPAATPGPPPTCTRSFRLHHASSRFVLFFSIDTASFLRFHQRSPGINLLAHSTSPKLLLLCCHVSAVCPRWSSGYSGRSSATPSSLHSG
ncbi:hypothetical protein CRENBAI_013335 [Crenichthys baileyi]|uniref:Uncharacterized protein n=1 Tax=Crenichthys baileyi TaxID=28760 RepID=A0AAV9SMB1_9TELE